MEEDIAVSVGMLVLGVAGLERLWLCVRRHDGLVWSGLV